MAYRYDITILSPATGDTRVEPKVATISPRPKGARISLPGSGGPGNVAIPLSDLGTLVPNDTVQINGVGAIGTVQAAAYSQFIINVNFGVAVTFAGGDRLVRTTVVTAFKDELIQDVLSPVVTDVNGAVAFYTRQQELDLVATVGSIVSVLPDQPGLGGRFSLSTTDFGAGFDGVTADATATNNAFVNMVTRGKGLLELPPGTSMLGLSINVTGFNGFVIRGQGKGITKLLFTTAATQWLLTSCTDLVFEDLTIGRIVDGSAALVSNAATCTRTVFRNCHFERGSRICVDAGVDTLFENCTADGVGWLGLFQHVGAVRPVTNRFVARIGNSIAAPNALVEYDQACISPRLLNPDFGPSGAFNFICLQVQNSGGAGVAGPTNLVVDNPHFESGTLPCVKVLAPSAGGGVPRGLNFRTVSCEDSERAFDLFSGICISIDGLESVGMVEECIYARSGVGDITIEGINSSHIGANKDHVRIDGSVFGFYIDRVKGGNFLRSTAGNVAASVVHIEDGIGLPGWVMMVSRTFAADVLQVVDNDKGNNRLYIYVSHCLESSSTPVSPDHEGFGFKEKFYDNESTTPLVEGTGSITLAYDAGITITDFLTGAPSQLLMVTNIGANTVTIAHNAAIRNKSGASLALLINQSVLYQKSEKSPFPWLQIADAIAAV